ncbi:hypothetical protein DRE_07732 [Drechslerella stenobrocha 248]|uniref:Uncharacterized protein n=1 Tax=Drechslerella stenobrocha 248 TaxID=1043628 RepID=W7HWI7_9PEZI|nr:hypothetical protein DRE_07732 [Drechslerella stenobrocha 248]
MYFPVAALFLAAAAVAAPNPIPIRPDACPTTTMRRTMDLSPVATEYVATVVKTVEHVCANNFAPGCAYVTKYLPMGPGPVVFKTSTVYATATVTVDACETAH